MAICPFATFEEITGPVGAYSGGPFKIVHHTTEGSTYAGAKAAFRANRSDPHFTVTGEDIFQHIDTGLAARSLRNPPGGVETNRDSAVQIEVVGFAGSAKDVTTLRSVARLCRWIESEHGVTQVWPSGRPRASSTGHDPGGHNRNAENWDALGGHYGHSQVPENTHWDPAYTAAELAIVTPDAAFDPHDELAVPALAGPSPSDARLRGERAAAADRIEAVIERVLAAIAGLGASTPVGAPASITVHAAVDGVEVEVTLRGEPRPASASRRRSRPRRTPKRARKR